ncbi:GntR family transcriptional regulator [Nesterenkonia sp. HG001]|uniref:GntR family transcriptional regulator n=1 Tax=Nesterenkonia sp. HG001 TaxID=2983207 RepID=UPI002AC4E3C2|nr:GntR family transcriptional regulator [Nesterenkonia sp. HG001]MDZ5076606.1 GntR family transcriptional regulator [Nesterenkonia sp. HG001]
MVKQGMSRSERHHVYDQIRGRIIDLELLPGTAISENELARALGVSRTPIREALLLLTKESLVEVFPKVGTFVSRVDPRRVAEAQFLREAVELASLRTLVEPFDDSVLERLRQNLADQSDVGGDVRRFFVLDEEFHRGLMALAGHEGSWSTVASAKGHLDRARMLGIQEMPRVDSFVEEHRSIFDAVVAGRFEEAGRRLAAHLRVVFDDIETIRAKSPELFVGDSTARPVRRPAYVWESPQD